MIKVLFIGDCHGDLDFLDSALYIAREHKCNAAFQVGDFGFFWPRGNTMDLVSRACADHEMPLYWIDGNHDWHPEIRKKYPALNHLETGGGRPDSMVQHIRRGHFLTICPDPVDAPEETLVIAGLGGAPSIDREYRISKKIGWWPEEEITEADLPPATHADVLACHDAPRMPLGFNPTGNVEFDKRGVSSHAFIEEAVRRVQPELLVHGHWHKKYNSFGLGGHAIEGLDCNHATHALRTALLLVTKDNGKLTWETP